jgi:hypothetical protein
MLYNGTSALQRRFQKESLGGSSKAKDNENCKERLVGNNRGSGGSV